MSCVELGDGVLEDPFLRKDVKLTASMSQPPGSHLQLHATPKASEQ